MATYSERIEYKEEIFPNQTIQLRTATVVLKDGVEIGRQYHRECFAPGEDLSAAPQEVKDIASALWSAAVILAYRASLSTADIELSEEPEVETTDLVEETVS